MTSPEAAPTPTRGRRLLRGFGFITVLCGVAAFAGGAALLFPYLRDDYALDHAVQGVALDWRDFGEERARQRLDFELANAAVGHWVGAHDCAFTSEQGVRQVHCHWGVELRLPWAEASLPLSFESRATVTATGDLQ